MTKTTAIICTEEQATELLLEWAINLFGRIDQVAVGDTCDGESFGIMLDGMGEDNKDKFDALYEGCEWNPDDDWSPDSAVVLPESVSINIMTEILGSKVNMVMKNGEKLVFICEQDAKHSTLWANTAVFIKELNKMSAEDDRALDCANIIRCIKSFRDDICEDALYELAERILDVSCLVDDGRFTIHDLADAVGSYPVDVDALLELEDEEFNMVMLCMAQRKRDTYSTDPVEIPDAAKATLDSITISH